jgi:hypothetical protein
VLLCLSQIQDQHEQDGCDGRSVRMPIACARGLCVVDCMRMTQPTMLLIECILHCQKHGATCCCDGPLPVAKRQRFLEHRQADEGTLDVFVFEINQGPWEQAENQSRLFHCRLRISLTNKVQWCVSARQPTS